MQPAMVTVVTGAAGFIGSETCRALLARGDPVVGIDNLNDYYDPALKQARIDRIAREHGGRFIFEKLDFADADALEQFAKRHEIGAIVHFGAQAGVRYSIGNPAAYVRSNLIGQFNMLELARRIATPHFVYASSSSVYGGKAPLPFRVEDRVDHPLSLYAATKRADELLTESYSNLYHIPSTGLRFFTVYGPWGRPDMSLFLFTRKILAGEPIDVFNNGNHSRDFTYIDDIVQGVIRVTDRVAAPNEAWNSQDPDPGTSAAPYRIYNIGNHQPVELMRFIGILEECLGLTAEKNFLPMQAGDVPATYADVDDLVRDVDFSPATPIETGIARFVEWYRAYYKDSQ